MGVYGVVVSVIKERGEGEECVDDLDVVVKSNWLKVRRPASDVICLCVCG